MPRDDTTSLADHLFAELERLGDESLEGDALRQEVDRARAIGEVAGKVIETGKLMLDAAKFRDSAIDANVELPRLLNGGE